MKNMTIAATCLGLLGLSPYTFVRAEEDSKARGLAARAQQVLQAHCHRCHGQDGTAEGGFNYILDRGKLVARGKIIPGQAEKSPLLQRVMKGKMPPPDTQPRPTEAEVAVLRQWVDTGAPATESAGSRQHIAEATVYNLILADLEKLERRSRRFQRYFTLVHLHNAGLGTDELQTYRHALAKLLNSLSWHPRITLPVPIDPDRTILRIDLRDFMWDANLWNRVLAEYPYGVLSETTTARAVTVATATRMPFVRGDWFVATASRPPLYMDLLQLPSSASELERILRVDAAVNILQERVARAGFNGSGISKNNRLIERHDAVHGAYWRSYDFDAVPQNLVERQNLLPDRRNLFAYPLGPGFTENTFLHAGGEIIFNLPNGLHAYMLVNQNGIRIEKGPLAIVSDPRRPDRAVETGISCIGCHITGILPKTDQIRAHVKSNPKLFSRQDAEQILALYTPEEKMKALMEEDMERYRQALARTGARISATEPVMLTTLRYEADLDLDTAASELGLSPDVLLDRMQPDRSVTRSLGALRVAGGTVQRQVFVQAFGDLVKELRLGTLFIPVLGQSLPDNTGEVDPLEGQSSQANAMAFSPDGRFAIFGSADKSVRFWELERNIEIRRMIGHTASVWAVAFSPDGQRVLSGSADNTVRLWEASSGQELLRLDGHRGLVSAVAFSPDGRRALSGSYDHSVILWDLTTGRELRRLAIDGRYINALAFAPDGSRAAVAASKTLTFWDLGTGRELGRIPEQSHSVTVVLFSPDGRRVATGGDDRSVRIWDAATFAQLRSLEGHASYVKAASFSPDGKRLLTGGADNTVRLWDVDTGRELGVSMQHAEPVIAVAFLGGGKYSISGSRNSVLRWWDLAKISPDK